MSEKHTTVRNISIHALREEGDGYTVTVSSVKKPISIHALREEGDDDILRDVARRIGFLSTPSARRATSVGNIPRKRFDISIHALREEGDHTPAVCTPTPTNFYPRPPRGGRLLFRYARAVDSRISIHALREEGDQRRLLPRLQPRRYFYPRPPRGGRRQTGRVLGTHCNFYPRPPRGGRLSSTTATQATTRFLSTPSARRATVGFIDAEHGEHISIHALREEGDSSGSSAIWLTANFYPRPPRGGRPRSAAETKKPEYFYPRPPRGGRQQKRRKTSPLLFHYKTICTDLEELFQKHPEKQL